ncbi:Short-chain dehydrogenase PC-15 [Cladobotryum mycophilum]|uniref:Short-chain dehydrogenase PC-15 n=1 Tax=Cladobotryum mycophilum TaxID=491253 RepID=A0ABR0SZ50_9HYPO
MSKQTVLITGCSDGGIGSALAVVLQQRGFHVFATARDLSKMSSLSGLSDVTLLALDVVKSADIKAAVDAVSEKTGGTLDYLISNAGRNHFMPILDEDLDAVRNLFEINVLGPIAITHAFTPLLIKSKGMVVYITSISGYLNIPYMGTYSASKRALEVVADTLRLELAPFNVDVLEVVTGGVKSQGQTYFGDLKLPSQSLYKSIEPIVVSRAQGKDGMPRMDTIEYATSVVDEMAKRTTGRFWCGVHADQIKASTTSTVVPQSAMDAGAVIGTGLDTLPSK